MGKSNLKFKYALVSAILLFVFICGLNYKQWYATNNLALKRVSLIYSSSKDEIGNGNIEKLLHEEFRKQGIDAVFDKYYLNCSYFNEKDEIEQIRKYLDLLKCKSIHLILAIGDQATYSLLSTHHQLLSSIPVVACNVHFPNEKLIEEYDLNKVYILRDAPDFKRNMDFIKTLHSNKSIEIIYNIDMTFLGHKSFDRLTHVVDRKNVRILGYQKSFIEKQEYDKLREMIEYFNLMPGLTNDSSKKKELTVCLCPFRYIEGASLLFMLEKSKREQEGQAFLLDKYDMMGIPIVNALNIPSYSCIREGFNEKVKIVGGYMATEEISAKAATGLATRLLNKEKIGMPKIRDLEKEYVLDWSYFSKYEEDIHKIPKNVRIINYPFYDRYRKELYLLSILFILAFILITTCLLRARRRSLIERKNLQKLEEAHKEQVERERQLILAKQIAEKAELKQSFLNNISHEIRTPLNAIVGFTNLLLSEEADEIEPEEKANMLNLINHNNDLLLKLVNDVVEISRLDSGNMAFKIETCDMTEIVKEIYKTYQSLIQPSLLFRLELDETITLPVNIDRVRFIQVISNFLDNANKFTKKGGITLGCKLDNEHQEVYIYVKDTGKGIDKKELIMIFDRFYKTDEFGQGSGLGLSISKVIIEQLGGRIMVESEVKKGSYFAVILSLADTI